MSLFDGMRALRNRLQQAMHRHALAQAYKDVFAGKAGELVLADLAAFCNIGNEIATPDAHETYALLGRRRVFLRIITFLEMSEAQLMQDIRAATEEPTPNA